MLTNRASGILLHPTSLPGAFGAGDFGTDAYRFVDWLISAGQTYWQILPLGETGHGNSPYMSSSAFAGNILLIDLQELADQGWLLPENLIPDPGFRQDRVDFSLLGAFHIERLRQAAGKFFTNPDRKNFNDYSAFCKTESGWLDDYALFMTIAKQENSHDWNQWPEDIASRKPEALQAVAEKHAEEIRFWKFCQWCFMRQWSRLKQYANDRGVRIIGDVPIFVACQSADVWSHQELFELDENGRPTVVAGVPPDYFSETGQLWGNPLYRWDAHEKTGYAWWVARLGHALKQADLVRIDHFRGFAAYWEIPAGSPNAINGRWVPGPGGKLFEAFEKAFPELPIIAEDLGVITPDVVELRDRFRLPGMRILQFAFGEGEDHPFLPQNYPANTVAYTGTHDNDTAVGWWNAASEKERNYVRQHLRSDGTKIQWDMMRALSASQANIVIFPLQDVLGLAGEHRMNYPGHPCGNWEWRFSWDQVLPWHPERLAEITEKNGRLPEAPMKKG